MLNKTIARIVGFCTRFSWLVIAISAVLTAFSGYYAAKHFAINTDITKLISQELPWRQRELIFEKEFPQAYERIIAVVRAPTPELAAGASEALRQKLTAEKDLFRSAQDVEGGPFFRKN